MLFRLPKSSNAFARSSQTLDEDLRAARDVLRDVWGYVDFRPAQLQAIRQVVQGKDGLVLMPTGGEIDSLPGTGSCAGWPHNCHFAAHFPHAGSGWHAGRLGHSDVCTYRPIGI